MLLRLLLPLCGLSVNANHHLATCASAPWMMPQTFISPFVCACEGLHAAGEYSPTMHHVAGSAPPTMHLTDIIPCGRGVLHCPALAFLACMRQGCLSNHASGGQGVLPNHTQCASEATPGLNGHRRQAGPGRRRHQWHHGRCRWTMMTCARMTIPIACMIALLCGCNMATYVAD